MAELFDNKTPDPVAVQPTIPETSFYDDLVGEGKKFSSTEALAKGKYESDLYVAQLQAENAGMRAQITEQESVSDMLDKAMTTQAEPPQDATPAPVSDPAAKSITPEEIQELVNAQVNSRLNADQKMANIQGCHDAAKAAYGDEYATILSQKSADLGLDQKFLEGIAADQPAAFKRLLIEEGAPKEQAPLIAPAAVPEQTVQSSVPGVARKNYAYYENLRKQDKVTYWSTPVQQEIWAAAKAQGPDFYT